MYYVYVLIFTTLYVKIKGIGIDLINKKCEFFVFIYKIYCSYVFLLSYFLCFLFYFMLRYIVRWRERMVRD